MIEAELSKKQKDFIMNSTAKINLAHGSVRSGKTFSTLLRWIELVAKSPDDKLVMIGKSLDSIMDNAVKPLRDELLRGYCTWHAGRRVLTIGGKDIRVIGANDQGSVGRIQGNTISGAYVDEMTILPSNFLDMLYTRLSLPHSKLIGTMNPDSPFHPLKKMIDEADGKFVYALHFNLNDNPSLEDDYKQLLEKLYSGLWYRRYILGDWCMAEGAIYDFFDRKFHVVHRAPCAAQYYLLGVDYGTSNPFAMVLLGVNVTNPGAKLWVEKEYYWNPKEMGMQKTDTQFADALVDFISGYYVKLIYLDPSAQSMEVELKNRRLPVRQADNDVLNGIRTTSNFISQGDLVILDSCINLIREMEGYVWDAKAVLRGEDKPLKANDHAVDSLRYLIFSHFGQRTTLKNFHVDPEKQRLKAEQERFKSNPMAYPGFTGTGGWQKF